jgi:hypothetical protein
MRKPFATFLPVILFFLSFPVYAQSQPVSADTMMIRKAVSYARSQFSKAMGTDGALYNGISFEKYWYGTKGTPFFKTEDFVTGNIYYDGTLYENVLLNYDLMRDQVVVKSINNNLPLVAISERISTFTLGANTFIRIEKPANNNGISVTGFYEKLYEGSVTVLSRKFRKIDDVVSSGEHSTRFFEFAEYFIGKDGVFRRINTQKDIQDVFADKKKEIRQFLNNSKLSMKKDPELLLTQAAAYYEQLTKK